MNRRRNGKKGLIRLIIAVAVILAVLAVIFLFQAKKVEVYGNTRHSSQEISTGLMNEVPGQNTLFLLWKYRNGTVPDTLPFLESLQVEMKSPYEVLVSVTEKEISGYIDQGQAVYFDSEGIVMEITDEIYEDVPVVTGANVGDAVLYQKLPTESGAQLRTMLSLLQLMDYHGLSAEEIRFGENMEITAFIGNVEVKLGQDEYLEEKIANLKSILEKMDEEDKGTLHLESFTGGTANVMFSPTEETEPVIVQEEVTADNAAPNQAEETDAAPVQETGGDPFMAFDANGTLRYDVRVVNGVAVDGTGTPVPGCTVDENGYVVDAYMNVIDPATGQPIQQ